MKSINQLSTSFPGYSNTFPLPFNRENLSLKRFTSASIVVEDDSQSLLTPEAKAALDVGQIPDLEQVCNDLVKTFSENISPFNALQFIPILSRVALTDQREVTRFLKNETRKYVLVQNSLIKVVLIHWQPGDISSIHGHAVGGCVFKVLKGQLEEKRFTPDSAKKLLSQSHFRTGGMAYIDDSLAYHSVGNPFNDSAISLHVYTPGI